MATLGAILNHTGTGALGVLDTEIDIPVISGSQRQGDVLVLRRPRHTPATTPIPANTGVVVAAAEASGGNTHTLHRDLDGHVAYFDRATGNELTVGMLTVPAGSSAYLVHSEEHGANAFGPGTYEIRRQREFAGEWRRVAD